MAVSQPRRRWFHRAVMSFASSKPGAWFSGRTLHHLDRLALRLTRGRGTLSGLLTGLPIIWLTTTGARTGQERRVPVGAIVDGERLIVIASNFGREGNPAWLHNLRAHPRVTVTRNGHTAAYAAREASAAEAERYWRMAATIYPGWAHYRTRTRRRIPVMVLSPIPADGPSRTPMPDD